MSTLLVYLYTKKPLRALKGPLRPYPYVHPVLGSLSRDESIRLIRKLAYLVCRLVSADYTILPSQLFSITHPEKLWANTHPVFPYCTQTPILFSRTARKHLSCFPVLHANTYPVFIICTPTPIVYLLKYEYIYIYIYIYHNL